MVEKVSQSTKEVKLANQKKTAPVKKVVSVTHEALFTAIAKFIVYRRGLPATPHHVTKASFAPPPRFDVEQEDRATTAAIAPMSRQVPLEPGEHTTLSAEHILHALSLHMGLTRRTERAPYSGNILKALPEDFPASITVVVAPGDGPSYPKPI